MLRRDFQAKQQLKSSCLPPGTNYIETLRVQIHANCRIRRIYFSDRLYSDPKSCCESELQWRFVAFCEVSYPSDWLKPVHYFNSSCELPIPPCYTSTQAESLLSSCYGGTGLYYRGDSADSDFCIRDCDPASKSCTLYNG